MRIENYEARIATAKKLLLDYLKHPRSVQAAYAYCMSKCPELSKREIRETRLEMGVESKPRFGIQYWSLPEENQ